MSEQLEAEVARLRAQVEELSRAQARGQFAKDRRSGNTITDVEGITDLNDPAGDRTATKLMWRGNNQQGWMLTVDGEIIPIIINWPIGKRFQAMVTTDDETMPIAMWKGLRPAHEAVGAVPAKHQWIDYLVEKRLAEIETEMREDKAKREEIRAEQERFRKLVFDRNPKILGSYPGPGVAPVSQKVKREREKAEA